MRGPVFRNLCQLCVYRTHPVMLTGYCLPRFTCDRCGRLDDCAMVRECEEVR